MRTWIFQEVGYSLNQTSDGKKHPLRALHFWIPELHFQQ